MKTKSILITLLLCLLTMCVYASDEKPPSNMDLEFGPDADGHVVYRDMDSSSDDYVSSSHAQWVYDALSPTQDLYLDLDFDEPYWKYDDRYNWFEKMDYGYAEAIRARIWYNTSRSNNQPYEIEHRRLVTHEMFHHVQYANVDSTSDWGTWLIEGGAKFMEDKLYDDIDNDVTLRYYQEVDGYLSNPNRRLMDLSYSSALYWNYLSERFGVSPNAFQRTDLDVYGGADFMKRLINRASSADPDTKELVDDLVRDIDSDSSFKESWQDFTIANYLKDYANAVPGAPVSPQWYGYSDDDDAGQAYRKVNTTNVGTLNSTGYSFVKSVTEWGAVYAEGSIPTNAQIYGVQAWSDEDMSLAVMRVNDSNQAISVYKTFGDELKRAYYNDRDHPVKTIAFTAGGLDDETDVEAVFAAGEAKIELRSPDFDDPAYVGEETNPERFLIRLVVTGPSILGSPSVEGLNYEDFIVTVGTETASVIYGLDVQGEYWLSVRAPVQTAGGRYDLRVQLGSSGPSATQTLAVDYTVVRRSQMLVVDESGSMASDDKLVAAINAGLMLTSVVPDDDQIGVAGFSADADVLLPLSTSNLLTRILAGLAVNSLEADGTTSIGDGLGAAIDELKNKGVSSNLHYITLLSDGKENESLYWNNVKASLTGEATRVNTIGFGPDADTDTLSEIAWQTDGDFYYVDTGTVVSAKRARSSRTLAKPSAVTDASVLELPNRLANVYSYIEQDALGQSRLWSQYGEADSTGVTMKIPVTEPDLTDGILIVNWNDVSETVTVKLTDPSGVAIQDGVAGDSIETATTVTVIRLDDVPQGDWTLTLTSSGRTVQFLSILSAKNVTGVEAQLILQGERTRPRDDVGASRFLRGLPMPINVVLTDDDGPVKGAKVQAIVSLPDGSKDALTLYDDGAHDDGQKNDGLYAITFRRTTIASNASEMPTSESGGTHAGGAYSVSINVDGVSNSGATFTRELLGAFHVYEYPNNFWKTYHVDDDLDGIPDRWEKLWGGNLIETDDLDDDGLNNLEEYRRGLIPVDADTDNGGEGDGSEVKRGANAWVSEDDMLPRPSAVSIIKEIIDDGESAVPRANEIGIQYPFSKFYKSVKIQRSTSAGGPFSDVTEIAKADAEGVYYDASVTPGKQYFYRVMGVGDGGSTSAPSSVVSGVAVSDPTPPLGYILLNNGAKYTDRLAVNIRVVASTDTASMRVSDSADFSSVPWRAFRRTVSGYAITPHSWNNLAVVFMELRDAAGNNSGVWSEAIVYDPDGDFDGDGTPNAIDPDDDGDGLSDDFELNRSLTNPFAADSNSNGTSDSAEDPDGDGLTNAQEESNHTNPLVADSDGDGFSDGAEISASTDPLNPASYPGAPTPTPVPTPTVTPTPRTGGGLIDFPFIFNHLKTYANKQDGVSGLGGVKRINITPDGRFIYASSVDDNSLAYFKRDRENGLLTYAGARQQQDDVNQPGDFVLSPDGALLYAVNGKGVLTTFQRNPDSGELKPVSTLTELAATQAGASFKLALSPDGRYLYAAQKGSERIVAFKRDEKTGALVFVKLFRVGGVDVTNPPAIQDMGFTDGGRTLLVLTSGDRSLASFAINPDSGNLVLNNRLDLNKTADGKAIDYTEIDIDPSSNRISLLSAQGGAVALLKRDDAGVFSIGSSARDASLTTASQTLWLRGESALLVVNPDGISVLTQGKNGLSLAGKLGSQELGASFANLTAILLSDDGKFLYAASRGDGKIPPAIHVFAVERVTSSTTPKPDLIVSRFMLSGDKRLLTGEVIGSRLEAIASNNGSADSADFTVGFYLSTDAQITTSDRLLIGGRESVSALTAGQSLGVSIAEEMAIPADVAPGVYFLGALADETNTNAESNETNNSAVIPVSIETAQPDLVPLSFRIDGEHELYAGETIGNRLRMLVGNKGNAGAGRFTIGVYLSEDETITTSDRLIVGGRESVAELTQGASKSVSIASVAAIPDDLMPGVYFLGVIVDETGAVSERDETNNTASFCVGIGVRLTNLKPVEFRLSDYSTLLAGEAISDRIIARVANTGDAPCDSFNVAFYLSEDEHVDVTDRLLVGGREQVSGLNAGEDTLVSTASVMSIPPSVVPGWYYLGVLVDETRKIAESDEDDNVALIPVLIGDASGATPTPRPTATPRPTVQPTPTPQAGSTAPKAIKVFTFNADTLDAEGFLVQPGGFINAKSGLAAIGPIPTEEGSRATDGRGVSLTCQPGEVITIFARGITVGRLPVVVSAAVMTSGPEGKFALAALDGSFDGSINALIPANNKHLAEGYRRVSLIYQPTTSDTLSVVLQLEVEANAPGPVTVYVDNVNVIPLTAGTLIGPNSLKIDRITDDNQ